MNTWELAEEIVEFISMASEALTDGQLIGEIDRIIREHVSDY